MMAKVFRFKPDEVDSIEYERVVTLMQLEAEYIKKQNEESERRK